MAPVKMRMPEAIRIASEQKLLKAQELHETHIVLIDTCEVAYHQAEFHPIGVL